MALLARLTIIIPLVLSAIGLILAALSLSAGHKEGFMEEYALARVNVSRIGYDLIKASDTDGKNNDSGGFLDIIKDLWDDAKHAIIDKLNDLIGGAVDEVADKLGISDWYSVHVMNGCEGSFQPNGTVKSASFQTTNCSDSKAGCNLGPFDIKLPDLGWTDDIQANLDSLNEALLGFFVLYVLGITFCGLSIPICLAAFVKPQHKKVVLSAVFISLAAASVLVAASIIATVMTTKGITRMNLLTRHIGVEVQGGHKFLGLTWTSAVAILLAFMFWGIKYLIIRKGRDTPVASAKV
uniref:SUR7 protein n=1 Tax=Bionectria ochroleuca TaxID=29856 RepID=A0A0B7KGA8_BIOOC